MVSTSKILTVSYGTFSCTLEGFDEPFNTMKSIAEYFRDLAADDRYFGAEPPTPDAEMLHRIAEREIQKRVEARVENDEVVLRQADAAAPRIKPAAATLIPGETLLTEDRGQTEEAEAPASDAAPTPAAAPTAEEAPVQDAVAQQAVDMPAKAAPEAISQAAAEVVETPDTPTQPLPADSIAAKLQRIRAVVDRGHEEAPESFIEDANAEPIFEDTTEEVEAEELSVEDAAPAQEPVEDIAADAEEDAAKLIDVAEEAAKNISEDAPAEDPEEEAEIAEIQEDPIEDPVEEAAEEIDQDLDDAPVAETAVDAPQDDRDALAAVMGAVSLGDDLVEDAEEERDAPTADSDPDISAVLAGLQAASEEAEVEAAIEDDAEAEAEIDADLAEEWDNALGEDLGEDLEDDQDAASDADGEAEENVFAEDDEDVAEAEDAPAAPVAPVAPRRPIARVIKVKRSDYEQAAAPEAPAAPLAPAAQGNEDSMLTPEEEADLMAELAEVERDFTEEGAQDDNSRPAFEDAGFDESDAAVDRILAETNSKMDSTDVSRRRSAIAHLKAAVQATRADEQAGDTAPAADDTEAYRDDLARVVRPRRPGATGKGSPRRLAPLMLVSEQRIDTPAPEQAAPAAAVRPRRVTKGNLALDAEEDEAQPTAPAATSDNGISFAAFAAQTGASEIGELLEAAAAHATFIEGRPHFTRPQVMKMALTHDPDAGLSREEGLRAFGKLLREGRIRKLKRGQFVLNEATRFRPDAQRASA